MINSLTPNDTLNILKSLPLKEAKLQDNEYIFLCPYHNDSKPSFSFNIEKGYGACWSCKTGKNLYTLVYDLTGQNLYKFAGIDNPFDLGYTKPKLKNIIQLEKTFLKKRTQIYEDFKILGSFKSVFNYKECLNYLYDRHYTNEMINKFEIKYADVMYINDRDFSNRIIIPIKNEAGKIISYEGRYVGSKQFIKDNNIKKVLYPKDAKTNDTIFNLHNLNYKEPLYLVEGINDIPNTIAATSSWNVSCIFGTSIKPDTKQAEILNRFETIVVIFDPDKGGITGIRSIDKAYNKEFYIVELKDKDPDATNTNDLKIYINKKKPVVDFYLDYYKILKVPNIDNNW